jgi:periplasmic protein TonB
MKRIQSFSVYALLIALLVHMSVVLMLILFNQLKPIPIPPTNPPKPKEERLKITLKSPPSPLEEQIKISSKMMQSLKKESILDNNIQKQSTKLSIPHGEQLTTQSQPMPAPKSTPTPPQPETKATSPEPIPQPKKAFERHVAKTVASIERRTLSPTEFNLHDSLSKPDSSAQEKVQSSTKISDTIQRLYGDKFNELSEGEQQYILDNQEAMRRITQKVLDRYAQSRIPNNIRTNDTNMIEFYLHPDGSISNIRFLQNSQLSILNDTTKEVIELSYAQYPRPKQKTLIRYRVAYNLIGY